MLSWLMAKLKKDYKARPVMGSRLVPNKNINTELIEKILIKKYGWDIFPLPSPNHVETHPFFFQRDVKYKSGRTLKVENHDLIEKITIYKNIVPFTEKSRMIKIKEYSYDK